LGDQPSPPIDYTRTIFLLRADTHAGHLLGLLSPYTTLKEEDGEGGTTPYTPSLTRTQEWLWHEVYAPSLSRVATLAGDDPIISLHLGDYTHGVKYPQQLVSSSIANQILIAIANEVYAIEVLPTLKSIRVIEGTDSHELHDATSPILLSTYLEDVYPHLSVQLSRHHYLEIGQTSLDCAHHGPHPGSRKWLEGNAASYYLRDLMFKYLSRGETPPTLVLRAHRHTYIAPVTWRIYWNSVLYTSTLILLPPLCGMSRFARQVTQSSPTLTCGLVALEVINGFLTNIYPYVVTKDLRSKEVIPLL